MRAIALLVTVAVCLSRTAFAGDDVTKLDRIIVECSEERMLIHLRMDFKLFSLRGEEPECKPFKRNFTEYDGNVIEVLTWSLPLNENADGPCGLRFGPFEDSDIWVHSTTIFGPDHPRTAQCIKTGLLDKRAARIRVEQITPELKELHQMRGTIEVAKGATISTFFHHLFPQAAGLSLHPITCWMINERQEARRLVVDGGCPVRDNENNPIVSLGSETASMATGDHPHVFFNADAALFENENNPSDLPAFRLQCRVIPCKGADLYQQVIGVARCPSIAWCQSDKRKMTYRPTDTFEVNQEFSLVISPSSSVPAKIHRELGIAIYPGLYMAMDTQERERQLEEEEGSSSIGCVIILGFLLFVALMMLLAYCAIRALAKSEVCKEQLKMKLLHLTRSRGSAECHTMEAEPAYDEAQ